MKCGLLGHRLSHSYSPAIHQLLGDYEYQLYEVEPEGLKQYLLQGDFDGLNVTMPYKTAVIPYLDGLTDDARNIGAVNTIYRQNGKLCGHNSDLAGFREMVRRCGLQLEGKKCLVLGSGGAGKMAVHALTSAGAQAVTISRAGKDHYGNLERHKDAKILINATPVGMFPHCGESPVDLDIFDQLEAVLDVIYNPIRTKLLMDAEKKGLITSSGLWMLIAQAKVSAEYFTGKHIPDEIIRKIHSQLSQQMENIILIGMPGCGKSTIGRLLAEKTGKSFVDTDAEIEKLAGKRIPDIFKEDGEDKFRELETAVIAQFGKQSGLVLATGGGCITRCHNYPLLHQNGIIFWLLRDTEKLITEGRPLSVGADLQEMYRFRKPMYEAFADFCIDNDDHPAQTVAKILTYWEER